MNPSDVRRLWQLCFDSEEGAAGARELAADTKLEPLVASGGAIVVAGFFDDRDDRDALTELARLRSRLVPQIVWLRAEPAAQTLQTELLALGFDPAGAFEDRFAYAYDLARCNQPRDWNNAEHWANPTQFKKRW
ncbi:MAG: DUF6231 family protein [Pseudomonadota bacterium]